MRQVEFKHGEGFVAVAEEQDHITLHLTPGVKLSIKEEEPGRVVITMSTIEGRNQMLVKPKSGNQIELEII